MNLCQDKNGLKLKNILSGTIGFRIRELRKARGYRRLRDLASAINVTVAAVSDWELSKAFPDGKNLIALARVLGVTVEELQGGELSAGSAGALNEIRTTAMQESRPLYNIRGPGAEALAPYVPLLIFIHNRDPDRWAAITAIIESVHRDVGGGKRGARRKSGE